MLRIYLFFTGSAVLHAATAVSVIAERLIYHANLEERNFHDENEILDRLPSRCAYYA